MRKNILLLIVLIIGIYLTGVTIYGQGNSSIYLIKIKKNNGSYSFHEVQKITDTKAYNNQPHFLPDGNSIFYSSAHKKQTEIYRYFILKNKNIRITKTPISEYSPTPMPDNLHFSVVQLYVEEGSDKGTQPLVAFPIIGGKAKTLYRGDKKVGYHAWIDRNRLALFVLGSPHSLQYYNLKTKKFQVIAKNIGRCIQLVPGKKQISFSQPEGIEKDIIKTVDFTGELITSVIPLKKTGDYFKWVSPGLIISASESKLYQYRPGNDQTWIELEEFAKLGLKNISRIAFSEQGERLAVVSGD